MSDMRRPGFTDLDAWVSPPQSAEPVDDPQRAEKEHPVQCALCRSRAAQKRSVFCKRCGNLGVRPEDVLDRPIREITRQRKTVEIRVAAKKCVRCKKRKDQDDFARQADGPTGLYSLCRLCDHDRNHGVVQAPERESVVPLPMVPGDAPPGPLLTAAVLSGNSAASGNAIPRPDLDFQISRPDYAYEMRRPEGVTMGMVLRAAKGWLRRKLE